MLYQSRHFIELRIRDNKISRIFSRIFRLKIWETFNFEIFSSWFYKSFFFKSSWDFSRENQNLGVKIRNVYVHHGDTRHFHITTRFKKKTFLEPNKKISRGELVEIFVLEMIFLKFQNLREFFFVVLSKNAPIWSLTKYK